MGGAAGYGNGHPIKAETLICLRTPAAAAAEAALKINKFKTLYDNRKKKHQKERMALP